VSEARSRGEVEVALPLREVTPRLKPDPVECVCGCGTLGQPRRKAWNDGLAAHVKGCPCRRCVGSRQRGKSRKREHRVARDTGGQREIFSGQLSGVDGRAGLWVWEETSEQAVCRGLRRWWNAKTVRTKVARLYGRPGGEYRAVILTDEKPHLVVMLYEDWAPAVRDGAL
jgi:hypothetical protein